MTARWGYAATTPDDIVLACIMQVVRWLKRMEGVMSDALASADLGTLLYTQSIDPDIAGILKDGGYMRMVVG